jgi:hypothetical protein
MRALQPTQLISSPLNAEALSDQPNATQRLLKPLLDLVGNSENLIGGSVGQFLVDQSVFHKRPEASTSMPIPFATQLVLWCALEATLPAKIWRDNFGAAHLSPKCIIWNGSWGCFTFMGLFHYGRKIIPAAFL